MTGFENVNSYYKGRVDQPLVMPNVWIAHEEIV